MIKKRKDYLKKAVTCHEIGLGIKINLTEDKPRARPLHRQFVPTILKRINTNSSQILLQDSTGENAS